MCFIDFILGCGYSAGRINLDYFQENNEDKKVTRVGIEPPHSHAQGGDVTHRLTGAPNISL